MVSIRELRELKGWTQQQLAEAAGCAVSTVSKVENGGRVHRNTIKRLRNVLTAGGGTGNPETQEKSIVRG